LENTSHTEASTDQVTHAQSWLQEVVHGGFDKLAYMRSVAELVAQKLNFVNPALAEYIDDVLINELTER